MKIGNTKTIGCDLGDKRSAICVVDADGKVIKESTVATERESFLRFFTKHAPSRVVLEVGTHSRWVSELLGGLSLEVIVANPRRLGMISGSLSKNDRSDAEMLARLGRADELLLAPVLHRSTQAQADLAVLKSRDAVVCVRTKFINILRGLLKSFGLRVPRCTAEAFAKRAKGVVPPMLEAALGPCITLIESTNEQLKVLDKSIEALTKTKYPETARLQQVTGVGPITSLAFVLTVESPTRFAKSRTVGAFFGLRPKQDQSGDSDKQLRITKAGDGFVRRLLVGCAQLILGPLGPPSDLRSFGERLANRGGKNAKRRAVVAVARKLAVLLHRLWVSGEPYVPLGYRAQRATA